MACIAYYPLFRSYPFLSLFFSHIHSEILIVLDFVELKVESKTDRHFLLYVCMLVSRRSQEAVQQEGSFLDTELPPSTFTTSSTEQNDHKTTVSTSQDFFPNDIPDHSQHLMSCSLRSKSLERRPLDSTATVSTVQPKQIRMILMCIFIMAVN